MVSGEDLVEHMLWVASGKPLPDRFIKNPFVESKGWSFESRVYAEDPIRNFLPSIGPLITYHEPESTVSGGNSFRDAQAVYDASPDGTVVRVDSGVYEGGEISMYYDPMISKLITHGPDRPSALRAMARALDEYIIAGLGNNLSFLRSVVRNEKFAKGDYGTKFIEEEYPDGFKGVELRENEVRRLVALGATLYWAKQGRESGSGGDDDMGGSNAFVVTLPKGGEQQEERCFAAAVSMDGDFDGNYDGDYGDDDFEYDDFALDGLTVRLWDLDEISRPPSEESGSKHYANHPIVVRDLDWRNGSPDIRVHLSDDHGDDEGSVLTKVEATDDESEAVTFEGRTGAGFMLRYRGARRHVVIRSPRDHELSGHMLVPEEKDMSAFLVCPMPGTLISCAVQEGDVVEEGQPLAVVEAMKMQNVLRAEKAGRIAAVKVEAGQHLKVDQIILEFAQDDAQEVA